MCTKPALHKFNSSMCIVREVAFFSAVGLVYDEIKTHYIKAMPSKHLCISTCQHLLLLKGWKSVTLRWKLPFDWVSRSWGQLPPLTRKAVVSYRPQWVMQVFCLVDSLQCSVCIFMKYCHSNSGLLFIQLKCVRSIHINELDLMLWFIVS